VFGNCRSNRRIPDVMVDDGGKLFQATLKRVLEDKPRRQQPRVPARGLRVARSADDSGAPPLATHVERDSGELRRVGPLLDQVVDRPQPASRLRLPRRGLDDDFLGIWIKLAEDWVQADGRWTLNVPGFPIFQGNRLQFRKEAPAAKPA
jgi:hypothetical protein